MVPEPKRLDLTPEKYGKGNYLGGEVTPVPEPGAHTVRFDPKSRSRLTRRDIGRFPGETLFARVARAICEADYLPRKELFESWEVARRVRRRVRGRRVVEFASGHALVAHLLLLLDSTSESAVAIDAKPVPSADRVAQTLVSHWPRLEGRVERRVGDLAMVDLEAGDLVVSVHACGALSDTVLDRAIRAQAVVALLPCCQDAATCDTGGLLGFLSIPLAVDATRVARLRAAGYDVFTQTIPAEITPHNRLILGVPQVSGGQGPRGDLVAAARLGSQTPGSHRAADPTT